MIVTIQDRSTLVTVHPARVGAYLQSRGWRRVAADANRYSIWVDPSAEKPFEILLPLDSKLGDFAERMAELLRDLQQIEQRSQLEILRDIEASGCDTFRFRKALHSSFTGTMPLEEGVRFVSYARDLLLFAASAEHEPRAVVTGRRSEEVGRFMNQASLGQTESGSFVVTAQVPVPLRLHGELFPESLALSSEPFERRAGIRLMSLLQRTRDAALEASQTDDFTPFNELLSEGASFNLYNSLVEANELGRGEALEISCSWAPCRPILGPPPPRSVVFERELISPIRSAVDILRPRAPKEGVPIFGFVELLQQEAQEVLIGDLAIRTVVAGRVRRVYLRLLKPEYDQAIQAFQEKRPIEVTGDLVKVNNRWSLLNPQDLVLHPDAAAVPDEEESS